MINRLSLQNANLADEAEPDLHGSVVTPDRPDVMGLIPAEVDAVLDCQFE